MGLILSFQELLSAENNVYNSIDDGTEKFSNDS